MAKVVAVAKVVAKVVDKVAAKVVAKTVVAKQTVLDLRAVFLLFSSITASSCFLPCYPNN